MTPFERSVAAALAFFLLAGLSVRVYSARAGKPLRRVAAAPVEPAAAAPNAASSEIAVAHRKFEKVRKQASKVALNRATFDQLVALPKIGPSMAKKIIAARDARGGSFKSLQELLTVPGIKQGIYRAIEPNLTLEPE